MEHSSGSFHPRQARPEDIVRLVAIHTTAFPDERGHQARVYNFTRNVLGGLDVLWVLEERGVVVAHAFLFALEAWFGGSRVRVGGAATLGVAPEARGRGAGSSLMRHLHGVASARGDALVVLYPFRQGFYARLGYATVAPHVRVRLDPRAIPWRVDGPLRTASGDDRAILGALWDAACADGTGGLVRSPAVWEARLLDERRTWLVAEGPDGPEGYLAWTIRPRRSGKGATLVVRELVARSDRARRSLWGAIGAQRDQVSVVRASVAGDDPILAAVLDGAPPRAGEDSLEHVVGEVVAGPMVRITDAAAALAARGWPRPGDLVLSVEGEKLLLCASGGRATATPTQREADVSVDRTTLAAMAFGGLSASSAAALGRLDARSARSLAASDALFACPPYFSPDTF